MEDSAPLLWWRLDETSGTTVIDYSGNGYNGETTTTGITRGATAVFDGLAQSTQTVATTGNSGVRSSGTVSALSIVGNLTALVNVNLAPGWNEYPKLLWKPTDATNGRSNYQIFLEAANNRFGGRVNIGGSYHDVYSGTISSNTDYMLILRRDGTELALFVNGTKYTASIPSSNLDTSTNPLQFGKLPAGSDSTRDDFAGLNGDRAVWNRAITDAEAALLYSMRDTA